MKPISLVTFVSVLFLTSLVSSSIAAESNSPMERQEVTSSTKTTSLDYQPFDLKAPVSGKAPIMILNNGNTIPVVGIGTYSLRGSTCVDAIYSAIKQGYRLIDTAYMYGNEKEVGQAVRKAIKDGLIKREDIFVITKLYPNQFGNSERAIEDALNKLDIDYIDMMLLHHPGSKGVSAYKTMEKYLQEGKIKTLGLSNFYIQELTNFLPKVSVKPSLVQNEIHPYYQDKLVVPFIQSENIAVMSWYPLGGRGFQRELLNDPELVKIAKKYGKSVAQVILRWDLQNGVIVIPGSSNPSHIAENIDIFDFSLTPKEMKIISDLDRHEKHDWY